MADVGQYWSVHEALRDLTSMFPPQWFSPRNTHQPGLGFVWGRALSQFATLLSLGRFGLGRGKKMHLVGTLCLGLGHENLALVGRGMCGRFLYINP